MLDDYKLVSGDIFTIDEFMSKTGLPLNYFNPDLKIPLTFSRTAKGSPPVYFTKADAHNTVFKMFPEAEPESDLFYSRVRTVSHQVNLRLMVDFKEGKMRIPKVCR